MSEPRTAAHTALAVVLSAALVGGCGPVAGAEARAPLEGASNPAAGRILANNDEWTWTPYGFTQAPDAAAFARHVAGWFTRGRPGRFLAYTYNFGFTSPQLAGAMTQAGHQWTVSWTLPFTLETLCQYDAVFVSEYPVDDDVLAQYVRAGGGVYVAGGTGARGPEGEAAMWNPFLEAFGLTYAPVYNGLCTTVPVASDSPLLAGVSSLFYCNGNSVSRLDPADPHTAIVHASGDDGLIGTFDGGGSGARAGDLTLWPPDHQYRSLSLADCAPTHACGRTTPIERSARITRLTSDEPEDARGGGDGATLDDMVVTGPTTFDLRAERLGSSDGRVYTVHYTVADPSGGTSAGSCQVTVPHDASGRPAVDSGVASCVGDGCP